MAAAALNIYQRMHAVMQDVVGVDKTSTNKHANYQYAGHAAITAALRPAYVKHGIVRLASVTKTELVESAGTVFITVRVSWICIDHESRVDVDVPAVQPSQTSKGGLTAQQVGQAISYAVKNAEAKAFSLTDSSEPDADEGDPQRGNYSGGNGHGNGAGYRSSATDEAHDLAMDYLARFDACETELDIKALNEEVKKNWANLRGVQNFSEHMVTARRKASARVRGAA